MSFIATGMKIKVGRKVDFCKAKVVSSVLELVLLLWQCMKHQNGDPDLIAFCSDALLPKSISEETISLHSLTCPVVYIPTLINPFSKSLSR